MGLSQCGAPELHCKGLEFECRVCIIHPIEYSFQDRRQVRTGGLERLQCTQNPNFETHPHGAVTVSLTWLRGRFACVPENDQSAAATCAQIHFKETTNRARLVVDWSAPEVIFCHVDNRVVRVDGTD